MSTAHWTNWHIAAGALAVFFANQSVQVLAIPFYQMTLAVDAFYLACAMALPLLLGSLGAAPLARWLGQQSNVRRHAWVLSCGSVLLGLSFAAMWLVPPSWDSQAQLWYFSVCSLGYFAALPLLTVPFTALLLEQAPSDQPGAFAIVSMVHKLGSLGYQWLVPLCQLSYFANFVSGVRQIGMAVALLLITLPAWWFAKSVRRAHGAGSQRAGSQRAGSQMTGSQMTGSQMTGSDTLPHPKATPLHATPVTESHRMPLTQLATQPAMRRLLSIGALQLCGCAAVAAYDFYLLVYSQFGGDLAEGATQKAWLSSLYAIAGLAWVPVLTFSQQRLGAIATLMWVFCLNALGGAAKWWLYQADAGHWVLLDALLCSAAWSAIVMLLPPLLHAGAAQHQASAAQVSALHHWLVCLSAACAMVLAGLGLSSIGFSPNASNLLALLDQLRAVLSLGTLACSVLALLLLWQVRPLLGSSRAAQQVL